MQKQNIKKHKTDLTEQFKESEVSGPVIHSTVQKT